MICYGATTYYPTNVDFEFLTNKLIEYKSFKFQAFKF